MPDTVLFKKYLLNMLGQYEHGLRCSQTETKTSSSSGHTEGVWARMQTAVGPVCCEHAPCRTEPF